MKKFKFFALMTFVFFLISYPQASQNNSDLKDSLGALKLKFPIFQNHKFPNGRELPTEKDLAELEGALLKAPGKLPDSLREFYKTVGNLRFPVLTVKTPYGGVNSTLYRLIREGYDKGLEKEWLSFCQSDGNDWFCMNLITGKIQRFSFIPKIEGHDEYDNLSIWIKKWWLSSDQ